MKLIKTLLASILISIAFASAADAGFIKTSKFKMSTCMMMLSATSFSVNVGVTEVLNGRPHPNSVNPQYTHQRREEKDGTGLMLKDENGNWVLMYHQDSK